MPLPEVGDLWEELKEVPGGLRVVPGKQTGDCKSGLLGRREVFTAKILPG